MVREDLIEGAISFLQDPSVASSPLETKISFLRSKNLTQPEIDASLARVGQSPQQQQLQPQQYQQQQQYAPPQQYSPQYGPQQPYWPPAPPAPPQRDWRDWVIMATALSGLGYTAHWAITRYITPLIAPPTPPQLAQDKAALDARFDQAFALLDQLAQDTQELKDAERARTERVDSVLAAVEAVVGNLKAGEERREAESRGLVRGLEEIREMIPKAVEREREARESGVREVAKEMRGLKTLVQSRLQGPSGQGSGSQPLRGGYAPNASAPTTNGVAAPATSTTSTQTQTPSTTTPAPSDQDIPPQQQQQQPQPQPQQQQPQQPATLPENSSAPASTSPFERRLGAKAQIPSWQLAAKKRSEEMRVNSGLNSGSGGGSSGASTPAAPAAPAPAKVEDASESERAQEGAGVLESSA